MCTYCIYTIFSIDSYYFYIRSHPYIALSFCRSSFNIRERIKSFGPSSSCSRSDLVLMVLEDLRVFFRFAMRLVRWRCSVALCKFFQHTMKNFQCAEIKSRFLLALFFSLYPTDFSNTVLVRIMLLMLLLVIVYCYSFHFSLSFFPLYSSNWVANLSSILCLCFGFYIEKKMSAKKPNEILFV